MADDEGGSSAMSNVFFIVGVLVVLVVLWVAQGGPKHADLRGIFLHPPTPVGQGGAYGPQPGTTTLQRGQ